MDRAIELLGTHPWIRALAIGVAALVAAQLAVLILSRVAGRLARRSSTPIDDHLLVLLRRPIFVGVFFYGLSLATRQLELPENVTETTVRSLKTLTVVVWVGFLISGCSLLLEGLARAGRSFALVDERTRPLLDNVAKLVILGGGIYVLLGIWHVDATAWLTSAGILGLALGFAAKDTLANLFSGIFILADTPYKIGDFINLDTGERGKVVAIGLRSTRLLTRDDIEIVIPNAVIANAKIVNETGGPWVKERIRVKVGVAYGSDVDRVCAILTEVAAANELVVTHPEPRARFRQFGASSLDFELLVWIEEPVQRGLVLHELHMAIYKALAQDGIEIPYAKRDVYIKELPPGMGGNRQPEAIPGRESG